MKKEAYYFSHDCNAQDDPKCMVLIDQLGMEGYGIFWALIERLRNEANYMLPHAIASALAKRWGTSKEKVEAVIKNYSLFTTEGDFFYSNRLLNSMKIKSDKARLSASYRWNNANALQSDSERNADGMQKDAIKVKKRKEKESNIPAPVFSDSNNHRQPKIPLFEDVHRCFINYGGTKEMATKFFETYEATEWRLKGSAIIKFTSLIPGFISSWKKYEGTIPLPELTQDQVFANKMKIINNL